MSATDPPPEPPEPPEPPVSGAAEPRGAVLAALSVVVVAVLVVPIGVAVVQAVRGGSGDDGTAPAPAPRSTAASPDVSPSPTSSPRRQPRSTPTPAPSRTPSPSSTPTPAAPRVSCWDGSTARRVSACTEPQGAAGLTWVFPSIAGQRCGSATGSGPDGVVLRRVCRARTDTGRVLVVYLQWSSTADAVAYVERKGLQPVGGAGSDRVDRFQSSAGGVVKVGAVYADEPFSYIATLPPGADPSAVIRQVVSARPADQVRGAPVS